MQCKKITLIGTTQGGRSFEVERLIKSLKGTKEFLELVFVDQTKSTEVKDLVDRYKNEVDIVLIKSGKSSLSKARNLAISHSNGNVIGFCDDDAFYKFDDLCKIATFFTRREILCCNVIDAASGGVYGGRKYPASSCALGYIGAMKYCLSVGIFLGFESNYELRRNVYFDERLGVGTELGGSEETELVLRQLSSGLDIKYDSTISVYHDNDKDQEDSSLASKYQKYAVGYAIIVKKYFIKSRGILGLELIRVVMRSLLGILFPSKREICAARLRGLFIGIRTHFE